jgi:hypothetical protein
MTSQCACGPAGDPAERREGLELACVGCGTACCPGCAVTLESVSYCVRCPGELLEVPGVRASGRFDVY